MIGQRVIRAATPAYDFGEFGKQPAMEAQPGVLIFLSEGKPVVMYDDGRVEVVGWGDITFCNPQAIEASLNNAETPEYTPPRWVPARDVAVGTSYLAAVHPDGQTIAECDSGVPLTRDDRDAFAAMGLLVLVGEWPPLPQSKS
jgi:hypothetical protein